MALTYLPFPLLLILMLVDMMASGHDRPAGYTRRDLLANLATGAMAMLVALITRGMVLACFAQVHRRALLNLPTSDWRIWAICFLLNELCYYWHHRLGHRVRLFWASHSVHHASEHFNLSVSFRLPVTRFSRWVFWAPLPLLGFDPVMVILCDAISMGYSAFLHTDRQVLPARLERLLGRVFNTPSLHRVHHASNPGYLDRNYGAMTIIWDRLFGTYRAETETPRYGITEPGPHDRWWYAAFGGYIRLWTQLRRQASWSSRLRFLLDAPDAGSPKEAQRSTAEGTSPRASGLG